MVSFLVGMCLGLAAPNGRRARSEGACQVEHDAQADGIGVEQREAQQCKEFGGRTPFFVRDAFWRVYRLTTRIGKTAGHWRLRLLERASGGRRSAAERRPACRARDAGAISVDSLSVLADKAWRGPLSSCWFCLYPAQVL